MMLEPDNIGAFPGPYIYIFRYLDALSIWYNIPQESIIHFIVISLILRRYCSKCPKFPALTGLARFSFILSGGIKYRSYNLRLT